MRKTDLTDRRPLATLDYKGIKAIMAYSVETLETEAEYKPGEIGKTEVFFELIVNAYNAGFNAGMRKARKELKA